MENSQTLKEPWAVVILSAGKGTRMKNDAEPKALVRLSGKPLLEHLVDAVVASGVATTPTIVVGYLHEQIESVFGARCRYVVQMEQKGTGHAVACARPVLKGTTRWVMVFYGDHPLVKPATIREFARQHEESGAIMSITTTRVPDFFGWRSALERYGRIVTDKHGSILRDVEWKDADDPLRASTLLNVGYYCFEAEWLWNHIDQVTNVNAQGEYYLTDLLKMAIETGENVANVSIDPVESLGVNSLADLQQVESFLAV